MAEEVKIDADIFLDRLTLLHDHFMVSCETDDVGRGLVQSPAGRWMRIDLVTSHPFRLQHNKEQYENAATLMICHGKPVPEGTDEPHAVTLQKHLLGYEFPETIMVLTPTKLLVHATLKKLEYLRPAQDLAKARSGARAVPVEVEAVVREKGDANLPRVAALVQAIKDAGVRGGG